MAVEMDWEYKTEKKIQYMTNNVWDGIKQSDVDTFMSNFDDKNKVVGLALLDMLIYYSNEQEESIVSNLIRLLKRDIWIKEGMAGSTISSDLIEERFDSIFENMCFIPVEIDDVSDSAFALTSTYKKANEFSRKITFSKVEDIPLMLALKKKYFVFYDDIIGTGKQFKTFWNKRDRFDVYSISDLFKTNNDVNIYYLSLGGCQDGIEIIQKEIGEVTIIVSEVFSKYISVLDEKNEYWELYPDKKEIVLNYISSKEKELGHANKFGKNIPVLFQHSRAVNTALSLYWIDRDGWKALYKR